MAEDSFVVFFSFPVVMLVIGDVCIDNTMWIHDFGFDNMTLVLC